MGLPERIVPRGRPYRSPVQQAGLVLFGVGAFLALSSLLWFLYHFRQTHGTPEALKARLEEERRSLLHRIEQFNARVSASPEAGLASLSIGNAGQGSSAGSSQDGSSFQHPIATMQAQHSMDSTATLVSSVLQSTYSTARPPYAAFMTADGATCDPPDPEDKYRMRPREEVEKENPELAALLKKHANENNEIMLTLANGIMICKNATICWWNGGNILESFLTILKHTNVTNHLIGVMDDETEQYLKGREGVNWFRVNIPIPKAQKGSHPANQVSTIKYTLLKTFLQLGYHTLITDMDLVYISNPFHHLHRDADVEIQTDGFDDTAYGALDSVHDPTMGWGGGGLFFRLFTTNVGCMFARATGRTYKLMVQVSEHLGAHPGWDQQIFNEYLMRPSHGEFQNAYAHLRVLDYRLWVNSKIFFRSRRHEYIPGKTAVAPTPVMVHFNYHPDKHKRMLCIMDRYFYGKVDACDNFPGGSEAGT